MRKNGMSFAAFDSIFAVVYIMIGTSMAFTITTFPFFILLFLSIPSKMIIPFALSGITIFPSCSAAFGVFIECDDKGTRTVFSSYFKNWMKCFWRSISTGAACVTLIVILYADALFFSTISWGAIVTPVILVAVVFVGIICITSLALEGLLSRRSVWRLLMLSAYLTVMKLPITIFSLAGLVVLVVLVLLYPIIGTGVAIGPVLFFFWSNAKYSVKSIFGQSEEVIFK